MVVRKRVVDIGQIEVVPVGNLSGNELTFLDGTMEEPDGEPRPSMWGSSWSSRTIHPDCWLITNGHGGMVLERSSAGKRHCPNSDRGVCRRDEKALGRLGSRDSLRASLGRSLRSLPRSSACIVGVRRPALALSVRQDVDWFVECNPRRIDAHLISASSALRHSSNSPTSSSPARYARPRSVNR